MDRRQMAMLATVLIGMVSCYCHSVSAAAAASPTADNNIEWRGESPQYTIVHSESSFDIRLYRPTAWMTATLDQISFERASFLGFHKLFQYSQGANMNFSRIPVSFPFLTGIVPYTGPFDSPGFVVRLYLPAEFQESPPTPLSELKLKAEYWGSLCVAVRKFPGFARDDNIAKEAKALEVSLQRSDWANATYGKSLVGPDIYTVAEYNTPFKPVGRLNEIWVSLSGSHLPDGCATEANADSMVQLE